MQTLPSPATAGATDAGDTLVCVICHDEISPAAEQVDCGGGPEHVGCHESDDAHLEAPAVTPWVAPTPDLAGVLSCGVEPTEAELTEARADVARWDDGALVRAYEAGIVKSYAEGLARAVRAGSAYQVASLVRWLRASSVAADERVAALRAGGAL